MSDMVSAAAAWMTKNSTRNLPRIRTASDLEETEIGSLLLFETSIQHYGVFLGDGMLAHLNVDKFGKSGAFAITGNGQGYVTLDKVSQLYRGETVDIFVDNSRDEVMRPYPPAVIVRRAREKEGPVDYDLFSNNCEHFATWCRYGKAESAQVNRAANIVSKAGQIVYKLFGN
ncbi:hras-like suppressor 3 [Plakobranchus ocellatus]|uniref:Hras-like suppressor 3 n=1 Tax=Plakobranchus ocellatus TaxID=259542 RepID=A0AAV4CTB5_9GAST|nr:hras-like suppressor 3 [Plakobranchus ocellatus]